MMRFISLAKIHLEDCFYIYQYWDDWANKVSHELKLEASGIALGWGTDWGYLYQNS